MASNSQFELIAEQIVATRGENALRFVAERVKDAADRGDMVATGIWQKVSEHLGLTPTFNLVPARVRVRR